MITLTREEAQQVLDALSTEGIGEGSYRTAELLRARLGAPEPATCGYDETTGNCTQNPCCYPAVSKSEWRINAEMWQKVAEGALDLLEIQNPRFAQTEPEPEKCIVRDCENHKHQGRFVGDLCNPCHAFITRNEGKYSQAYRNAQRNWQGLTDEEAAACWRDGFDSCEQKTVADLRDFIACAIESKLKEKNT